MHRRPRLILLAGIVAVAAAGGAGLWWWNRPLPVTAPAGAADPACAQLAEHLPREVRGQQRVKTSSGSPAVAAWGDPAVIWRCGVRPLGPTTQECLSVDGVDWVVRRLTDGVAFTTYGRDPAVEVLVPRIGSTPEPLELPPFSAVVAQLPQGDRRCS